MNKEIVKVYSLNYGYPDGTIALSNINLDIYQGESVAIIGPNGAGKSTFLLHLNGVLPESFSSESNIVVDDIEVNRENLPEIRKKVGLVFQNPDDQLFNPTVFEDIAFGPLNLGYPSKEIQRRVTVALEKVGMYGFEKKLSHHLSFGEKKRISLATVLSLDPKVIALDEPTSNLDPKSRREFLNLLNQMSTTKIIATHDLEAVVETCQKVVILDKGKICAAGETREILLDKELLEVHGLEVPYSLREVSVDIISS